MKTIILIFTLFFSILSFSQSENLVDITWICTSIVIEGDVIQVPNNDEVIYVPLQMTEDSDPMTEDFSSGVCNYLTSGDGNVTYNNPETTFTISQLGQTLITCDMSENGAFESNYFGFFYSNVNTPLSYETINIDGINTLTITTANGDTAHYEEFNLSVKENQLKDVNIYPNPATESITINSVSNDINRIEIYSITGRILKSIKKPISTIDISNFSQGIYILKVYNAKNFIIKKFVKK